MHTTNGDRGRLASNLGALGATARLLGRKSSALVRGLRYVFKKDKTEHLSIGSFIERNAARDPGGTALLFEDQRLDHRQVSARSNAWAHALASLGVRKGDAVGVLIENRPELLLAVAGTVKLGAIAAVVNTSQRKGVLAHSVKVSRARTFIVGEECADALIEALTEHPPAEPVRLVWVRDRGDRSAPPGALDAGPLLAAQGTHTPVQLAQVTLGDPCFYVFTSGTTGLPKASIMSHLRWVKAGGIFGHAALELGPDDTLYVPLPLYHNNGLTVAWAAATMAGAALAVRRRFSVSQFWQDVRTFQATAFVYIGELCRYLLNQPPSAHDRSHPIRRMAGNGLRPDIWKAFKTRFGVPEVYEFYAASEGNIAFVNLLNRECTVGLCPAPYAIVRYDVDADQVVTDARGHCIRVQTGEVGLLIGEVSERYSFDGYTDDAASSKKLLRNVFAPGDVWFNSGDLMRDQGMRHAQFVDRVGDTFRWKGENVSTNEVAEVVNGFAGVAETTVYGVEVPGAEGRCGMAAIVCDGAAGDFDAKGLARHVRAQLPSYAWPRFLRVRDALEVTPSFKQVKTSLRKDGFDPKTVADRLYVLPAAGAGAGADSGYVPLDRELYQAIVDGRIAL